MVLRRVAVASVSHALINEAVAEVGAIVTLGPLPERRREGHSKLGGDGFSAHRRCQS